MTPRDNPRLDDIEAAITAITSHLDRGDLSDGLVFDTVRARLIEIGEAVKALSPELLDLERTVSRSAAKTRGSRSSSALGS